MDCNFNMVDRPATYTIERTGTERDKRIITIVHDGKTERFVLTVRPAPSFETSPKAAPEFMLEPADEGTSHFASIADACSEGPDPIGCE